ncbi:glycerate kinase [Jeotgalicoccus huakuii]|uniref:glycerate kinase n=1 Tax=Jeotgalicoccus marinus TaxID=516700 RepID=UPI000409DCA6|nr:glycerate kinase [Jeotgalicoccus marinus]MCK1976945.1 glycerate kinase [Jeotgalicoccus huakuii]
MKIVVAMDSFKGSVSSKVANEAVVQGIESVMSEARVKTYEMADGGEGTTDILIENLHGQKIEKVVTGPIGQEVTGLLGLVPSKNLAIIEVASTSGLTLLSQDELNPDEATSYGLGELIDYAHALGARNFIIGLGGSATNDGGVGMLQAMGYRFLDERGKDIKRGGKYLSQIHKIIKTHEAAKFDICNFRVACDVNNTLYGEQGATYIFGPQKGVKENNLASLDQGLKNFADKTLEEMNIDISEIPGGGAAGGLGAAFHSYLKGKLETGVSLISDMLNIEDEIKDADLVISGEGKLDAQTKMGKVPVGIAKIAKDKQVPFIGLAGSLSADAYDLNAIGMDAIFSIQSQPMTLEEAMNSEVTKKNITRTTSQIMRLLKIGK